MTPEFSGAWKSSPMAQPSIRDPCGVDLESLSVPSCATCAVRPDPPGDPCPSACLRSGCSLAAPPSLVLPASSWLGHGPCKLMGRGCPTRQSGHSPASSSFHNCLSHLLPVFPSLSLFPFLPLASSISPPQYPVRLQDGFYHRPLCPLYSGPQSGDIHLEND